MDLSIQSNLTFDCNKAGSTFNHSVIICNQTSLFENHKLYSNSEYSTPVPWNSVHRGDGDMLVALLTLDMVTPSYPAVALASLSLSSSDSAAFRFDTQSGLGIILFCKTRFQHWHSCVLECRFCGLLSVTGTHLEDYP